jgi:GNAT superfamily N-acetyltransferase
VLIRETTIDDIPQIDLVRQSIEPWHVADVATQKVWFDSNPPEAKVGRWVAVTGQDNGVDQIAGFGWAKADLYADQPGTAAMMVAVRADSQRQGIGSQLYELLEQHAREIDSSQIQASLMGEPASVAFAERRGYVLGATARWIVVDPRVLPPQPQTPEGVTVLTAAEAGPEPFYAVMDVAARDEPGDVAFMGMPYEDWLAQQWPTADHELSFIAFVDGKPAATTALNANYATHKAMSGGTDALREYRGRGLVKLIKSISLRAAAAKGITAAYTGNDEVNAPMRAINAWLGYEYVGDSRTGIKQLS